MKKARIATFLLLILLLSACGKVIENKPDDTTTNGGSETTSPYDKDGFLKDHIPDDLDYKGKTVNILISKEQGPRIDPDEELTDVLSLATYERNRKIEERLGVNLNFIQIPGTWVTRNDFIAEVVRANAAGAGEYDLVGTFSLIPAVLAVNDVLINLMDLEYPQFDMPWWPEAILDEFMFYDTVFYATDTSSGNLLREMFVTYYNTEMIDNYHLEDPAQLAVEGKWTLDKLEELSSGLYMDLNNNQTVDAGDQFGLVLDDHSRVDAYYYGSGLNMVRVNDAGDPELTFDSDKEKINNYLNKIISIYNRQDAYIDTDSRKIMQDGRTAFFTASLLWIQLVETKSEYSIAPVPKLDEAQEKYFTVPSNAIDVWCIPNDAKDDELSGIILEAIASGSYRIVAPRYYDEMLKFRYSSNEIGVQIFDLIRQGLVFDFGRLSGISLSTLPEAIFRNIFLSKENTFASTWDSLRSGLENSLDNLLDYYRTYRKS